MSWSGFKKNVGRATTQVMMKTGHVEKTSDREYEVEERRYRTLESASLRLQKEAKGYLDSLRAMTASQMRIAETIDAFYGDSGAKDGVSRSYKQAVEDLDAETVKALDGPYRSVDKDIARELRKLLPPSPYGWNDQENYEEDVFQEAERQLNFRDNNSRNYTRGVMEPIYGAEELIQHVCRTTVLEPINRFCAYFPDINECIKKRNHKMLDYDSMRSKVKRLTEKPDKDPSKLPRTEKETEMVKKSPFRSSFISDGILTHGADAEDDLMFASPPKVLASIRQKLISTPDLQSTLDMDLDMDQLAKIKADEEAAMKSIGLRRASSITSKVGRAGRTASDAFWGRLPSQQAPGTPGNQPSRSPKESVECVASPTSAGSAGSKASMKSRISRASRIANDAFWGRLPSQQSPEDSPSPSLRSPKSPADRTLSRTSSRASFVLPPLREDPFDGKVVFSEAMNAAPLPNSIHTPTSDSNAIKNIKARRRVSDTPSRTAGLPLRSPRISPAMSRQFVGYDGSYPFPGVAKLQKSDSFSTTQGSPLLGSFSSNILSSPLLDPGNTTPIIAITPAPGSPDDTPSRKALVKTGFLQPSELEDLMQDFMKEHADLIEQAKVGYEQLNEQLTNELPQLIDLRVPYLDPSFEALVKIQLRFCAEAYSRMAQVQQYLDASTRDQYASGDLDARVEDVLGQIRELSIAGTV